MTTTKSKRGRRPKGVIGSERLRGTMALARQERRQRDDEYAGRHRCLPLQRDRSREAMTAN